MAMDDHTQHLRLPLPHPEHLLADDVLRIRAAFETVDAEVTARTVSASAALVAVDQALQRKLRRLRVNQLLGLDL